jgi:hypothetical protein
MKGIVLTVAAAIALAACSGRNEARAEDVRADRTKLYFGDPEGENPATVRASDCFDAIPEWQDIRRRELGPEDADYWILLSAANERFRKAVESVARAAGYDLVAEQGSITVPQGAAQPPDITKAVVAKIKEAAEDSK